MCALGDRVGLKSTSLLNSAALNIASTTGALAFATTDSCAFDSSAVCCASTSLFGIRGCSWRLRQLQPRSAAIHPTQRKGARQSREKHGDQVAMPFHARGFMSASFPDHPTRIRVHVDVYARMSSETSNF
jgi:hypothetical protein